jgi:nickel/cobalt exporter
MRQGARAIAVLALTWIAVLAWPGGHASAHPLGNFTVNLYSGLHVVPGEIRIDYVVDMAEIPTFQELDGIDLDGDGGASPAELQAWATRTASTLASNLTLSVDGRRRTLQVRTTTAQLRPGQGGLHTLRLEAVLAAPATRMGSIEYRDGNFPGRIGWREITAVGEDGAALGGSSVPTESVSDTLLAYPQDLLSSPLDVRAMRATFHPGVSVPVDGSATRGPASTGARPGVEGGPFAGLVENRGLPLVILGLALAMVFGAWHALLPGHGKTLMAAYMVGTGARVRQAVAVGSAVAIMHTASVLGLGLMVLTLEHTFRPEALYPWLGLLSGLVALGLGAHLMVARLASWSAARGDDHGHGHPHPHTVGPHRHPDPRPAADGGPVSRRGLVALALAGGILPAPSALLVMLAAINAHRVVYGLSLVLAFSVGLATALIVVGLGAMRAREALGRRLTAAMGRVVPVLSAGAIVVVGAFLTVRGVVQV